MEDVPMSIEHTARELGCSTTFIYRIIAEQKLAAVKVGRYIRVERAAVDEFLRTNPPPRGRSQYKIVAPRYQPSPRNGGPNGQSRKPTNRAA